jgi:CheY-like chemotaxis protein
VLERAGYRVLRAAGGAEGLAVAAAHPGPIHVLVTDVVMPGMSGRTLAQRIRELRSDTRVLLVSGYAGSHLGQRLEPSEALLLKPFDPQALLRSIEELLARPAGAA